MAKTPPFSVCNEFCVGGGGGETTDAKKVKYDNKNSRLKANNVNDAIDEINTKMNDIDTTKDWNQNDPTEVDYIKNRPFYEDTLCIANHSETVEEYSVFNPLVPINEGITLVKGERLLLEITVDGDTSYDEIERFWTDFLEDDDVTGVCKSGRFYSWNEANNTICVQTLADEILQGVVVKIYRPADVKQIDEKFIPDNIARIADLKELKLKNTVGGSLLSLPDSEEAPLQGMRIFGKTKQATTTGKNKLPYPYVTENLTTAGVTFTDNGDGSVTVSGTSTNYAGYRLCNTNIFEVGKTYQIKNKGVAQLYCSYTDATGATKYAGYGTGEKITWLEEYTNLSIYLQIPPNTTVSGIAYPIVVEGDSYDGNWEPYTGGMPSPNPSYPQALDSVGDDGSVEQFVKGKNLLQCTSTSKTQHGVTFTVNGDGTIVANGTSTNTIYYLIGKENLLAEKYYAMGFCDTGSGTTYMMYCCDSKAVSSSYQWSYNIDKIFTIVTPDRYDFYIMIKPDVTLSNVTFKPMLRLASITDNIYEPYKSQSLTIPTPNGLPGIPVSSGGNYTDENGQQYVSDYKDYERMVYVQRVGETAVTFKSTNVLSSGNRYGICVLSDKIAKSAFGGVSEKAVFRKGTSSTTPNEFYENSTNFVFVGSTDDTDETIRAKFEGSKLFYVLETPIETPLSEEEIAAYKALHTNYPNTTIYNDDGAYTEVKYVADTKNYVDNKIANEVAKLTAAIITE